MLGALYGARNHLVPWLVIFAATTTPTNGQDTAPLYGFTPLPFASDSASMDTLHEIILPNSTLYAVHLDQCVPWQQLLDGRRFPVWLRKDLENTQRYIPADRPTYVAITPTAIDRRSLAPACGDAPGDEALLPAELSNASFDHPLVHRAYVEYAARIIEQLRPSHMNLGIEVSELLLRHPDDWWRFGSLFAVSYYQLKGRYPDVQFGIELTLQSLQLPRVAEAAKPVAEMGDFVGISFYPHSSRVAEASGAPPLASGADAWRLPLDWLRGFTTKPIAICETGYGSTEVELDALGVTLPGSEEAQAQYVRDLVEYAKNEHLLFVVWFVAVDFDALAAELDGDEAHWAGIWVHSGLFDAWLRPKPAWREWFSQSRRSR